MWQKSPFYKVDYSLSGGGLTLFLITFALAVSTLWCTEIIIYLYLNLILLNFEFKLKVYEKFLRYIYIFVDWSFLYSIADKLCGNQSWIPR